MKKRKGRTMQETATVRVNLAKLIALKFEARGEEVNISQVARDTKLAMNTVRSLMRGGGPRFDGHTIAVMCRYLDCRIEDLLEIVDVGKSADEDLTAQD